MKKIIYLLGVMMVAELFPMASVYAVGAAYFPQSTTATLTQGSFEIVGGSDADTVSVISGALHVTISSDQTFKLRSSSKKNLTNDSGYNYTCGSEYSELIITSSSTRTVIITPDSQTCSTSSGGGGGGSPTTTTTTTASPTPTTSPTTTPTPTSTPTVSVPSSAPNLASLGLKEGDIIRGTGDLDVYIVNDKGYMRLFLNEKIFSLYAHLGFSKIKNVTPAVRNLFGVSGLFRNCETNDPKVYGVEITGEDVGTLHWVDTTGEKAVSDDPNFFSKVFCINNNEFNWYPKGEPYTSVLQIPKYNRLNGVVAGATTEILGSIKISDGLTYLNVRAAPMTTATIVGKVYPGATYTVTKKENGWYQIQKDGTTWGWVFGKYVKEI